MEERVTNVLIEEAVEDLRRRTLAGLPGNVARLVYLASTRDYNTGRYYHEGLGLRFTSTVASNALELCHREIFEKLILKTMENLTLELEQFVYSVNVPTQEILGAWQEFEPYRVLVPKECDSLCRNFFFSNVRIALAILETRLAENPRDLQSALPQQ